MIGREIFKIWAPIGTRWVDWIRPVPFITINDMHKNDMVVKYVIPPITYINNVSNDTAIIVDLPHHDSIEEGIALVDFGFRPIPVYNGTQSQIGAMAVVDNHLEQALLWGSQQLQKKHIPMQAAPAFLLDSNRLHRFKMSVSVFDNSWDLYAQDLPSAEYFLKNGIDKIIVRSDKVHEDICKILFNFQKKGIQLFFTDGYELPQKVTIKKVFMQKDKYVTQINK